MALLAGRVTLTQRTPAVLVLERRSWGGLYHSRATLDRGSRRALLEEWLAGLRRHWECALSEVDAHLVQHWSASVQGQTVLTPPLVAVYRFSRFDMVMTFGRRWKRYMVLGSFEEGRSHEADFSPYDRLQEFLGRAVPSSRAA